MTPDFVLHDTRIKAPVANCGTSEINSYFNYNRRGAIVGSIALPGSEKMGVDTHDYIAKIAPRAISN